MKILIVDDEVHVAKVLADSVRLQGDEAFVAGGGEEGLALLDQKRPDAVFLDIVMPGMGGIEVLRRIREVYPALPVIVITGHASTAEIEEVSGPRAPQRGDKLIRWEGTVAPPPPPPPASSARWPARAARLHSKRSPGSSHPPRPPPGGAPVRLSPFRRPRFLA